MFFLVAFGKISPGNLGFCGVGVAPERTEQVLKKGGFGFLGGFVGVKRVFPRNLGLGGVGGTPEPRQRWSGSKKGGLGFLEGFRVFGRFLGCFGMVSGFLECIFLGFWRVIWRGFGVGFLFVLEGFWGVLEVLWGILEGLGCFIRFGMFLEGFWDI